VGVKLGVSNVKRMTKAEGVIEWGDEEDNWA
jgi:hypothetical protein